jgi:hypothetical protein
MKKILIILIIIFISLCTQQKLPPSGGGGGGGGGGPPSCSASFSLTSTGKDTCTITSTITASYCDNKSYELKNGGTKCSGAIAGDSFSKMCDWTVSVGNYNYELYVDIDLKDSGPIVCKSSSKCSDGTFYDSCSATKPLYCDGNGNLINKCSFCCCPTNQLCNTTSEECYPICSDNTPYGQCSVTRPLYCDNGILINKCTQCSCPSDKKCNTVNQDCYSSAICSGSLLLSLNPSTVEPSKSVVPSVSGLSDCDSKNVYFRKDSCSGTQVSSCTLTDGGCTGLNFSSPSNEGLYTYYACIDKNDDGDFSDSGENSSKILNVTENINREQILNYLNFSLYHPSDTLNFIFTLDSYELLNETISNKAQVIEYLNSLQSNEGTWNTGKYHYVPTTASVLMFYNRSGVKPPKSLDPFFSTVDTWEEVNTHVKTYDSDNYWGGLWGYVASYVVYKHEAPPWTPEFLNAVNVNFSSWAYYSHQRTHLVGSLYMLGLPILRVDEIVTITLQQQKGDGSWEFHEPETVFNIDVLSLLRNQTTVDKSLIDSAISRGVEYIKKCYRTVDNEGKTYGLFVKNSTVICSSSCLTSSFSWYTAQGIFAVLNPTSDIWLRWFAFLTINKTEVDNSLEYLKASGLGVHDMAEYVISKSYLGIQIPSDIKQQIINYFDNNQNQTDGSWKGVNTPMFTTHRVLLAYYILNAKPNRSLDSFFSNYDTWEEALAYDKSIHGSFDGRDIYHIILGWFLYNRTYPTWLNDFFTKVEEDLTWTNSTNSHKRTHTLYSYVMTRRQFPNLDGIINETLREQSPDGHWDYQCLSSPRSVYCNAIQLVLLQQIIKLYTNHRTAEIQSSIDMSRQWVYDTYNVATINGVVMGYFGTTLNIEDAVMVGIMSAGINGLMDINVDMAFEDLIGHIS